MSAKGKGQKAEGVASLEGFCGRRILDSSEQWSDTQTPVSFGLPIRIDLSP